MDMDITHIKWPDAVVCEVNFIPAGMESETLSSDIYMVDTTESPRSLYLPRSFPFEISLQENYRRQNLSMPVRKLA